MRRVGRWLAAVVLAGCEAPPSSPASVVGLPAQRPAPAATASPGEVARSAWADAALATQAARHSAELVIASTHTEEQLRLLRATANDYRLASERWETCVEAGLRVAEALFWLADARVATVRVEAARADLAHDPSLFPKDDDLVRAMAAATAARDRGAPEQRGAAGRLLITVAQLRVRAAQDAFDRTHGAEGVPRRDSLDLASRTSLEPIQMPEVVRDLVRVNEEYLQLELEDVDDQRAASHVEAAKQYLAYNHLAEAKRHLRAVYDLRCESRWGEIARALLGDVAAAERDVASQVMFRSGRCPTP